MTVKEPTTGGPASSPGPEDGTSGTSPSDTSPVPRGGSAADRRRPTDKVVFGVSAALVVAFIRQVNLGYKWDQQLTIESDLAFLKLVPDVDAAVEVLAAAVEPFTMGC